MKRIGGLILLFLLLLGFWLLLAANLDWSTILFGVVVSILVVWYNKDLVFHREDTSRFSFKTVLAFLRVLGVVLWEVLKSNIHVAVIVLKKKMPINPGFDIVRMPLKKELNQALYANAITLTPGTLTVDIVEGGILVHGLVVEEVKNIENSTMERAFAALEGESK
jgi:multicomponent Na+:H+ antiporter subunit E